MIVVVERSFDLSHPHVGAGLLLRAVLQLAVLLGVVLAQAVPEQLLVGQLLLRTSSVVAVLVAEEVAPLLAPR